MSVANAAVKLKPPGCIDLSLIRVHVPSLEAAQAAMDQGSTVTLVKSEERLLYFRDVHVHAFSVHRGTDKQRGICAHYESPRLGPLCGDA